MVKIDIQSSWDIIKKNTGISSSVELELEKWVPLETFNKGVKSNKKLKKQILDLQKELEYERWKIREYKRKHG